MVKILQARLQQYVNHELPDVQACFRKGRGTRHQIANICWIIKKAREFQKSIYSFVLSLFYGPTVNFQLFKLVLEKAEEPEIKTKIITMV